MSDLKLAIILGSTRPGRNGKAVADWVLAKAKERPGANYELIDLIDYPLPHLDEPIPPSRGAYVGEHTKAWAATISEFDGYIFVTPEYNHSTSAVLKNAIDYIYAEWNNKAAAFVSYGVLGGARAIEHLRAISSELQIAHVRQQLSFSVFTDFENFKVFKPAAHHDAAAAVLFTQLESWASAQGHQALTHPHHRAEAPAPPDDCTSGQTDDHPGTGIPENAPLVTVSDQWP